MLLLCHVRVRSSRQGVFYKKGVLRNFAKFTRKHLCYSLFFTKEALAQVFSCEFCKISRNTFSYRTSPVAVSGVSERIYTLQFLNFLLETGTLSEVCVDSNFMEIQRFKHSSDKFSLLCCRLLDFFNENLLCQRGLDKHLQERFLLASTFSCQCFIKKGTLPQTLKTNFSNILQNSSRLVSA